MERNPWWKNVEGPFLQWNGPVGVKEDGGGCTRARGKVGPMVVHRAAASRDREAILKAVKEEGHDVNEVEGAGNTPLHFACYDGWLEGVELLLSLGAKVDASNNAGDRAYHWAENMGHKDVMAFITKSGGRTTHGEVLVQDHVPKVKDFYSKECWAHHPKPHQEYMDYRSKKENDFEAERTKLLPGL